MKHLFTYFFLGALLVSLSSCSKKENPDIDKENPLVGTWEAVRAVEREYIDGELSYEIDTENLNDHFTFDMEIEFLDQSRVRIIGEDIEGAITTTYSLSKDGKILSVKDVDEAFETIQIKKLTTTDMEWFMEAEGVIEGDEVDRQTYKLEAAIYLKNVN